MAQLQVAIIPVTAFQQNCTLVWDADTKQAAVFDPGGDIDLVTERIREFGLDVKAIYLTHGHIDHAGGAMELKEKLDVPIIGPHKDDEFLLAGLEEQAKMFGVEESVRNVTPDQWLKDGDTIKVGESTFQVVHCPGHSPGSVVYYNADNNYAQVGDVLFAGSIGRTDLPRGNHADLISSIKDKLLPLGDNITFISGHGPDSTFGRERESNPFLK